ncbi:MAG: hypothetical protein Q8L21_03580 [Candidatus Komeilibacteria bacterium]|nr:hypothetical protein [Candidatus Komeilibacteria bacterium]
MTKLRQNIIAILILLGVILLVFLGWLFKIYTLDRISTQAQLIKQQECRIGSLETTIKEFSQNKK